MTDNTSCDGTLLGSWLCIMERYFTTAAEGHNKYFVMYSKGGQMECVLTRYTTL